jgi:prolyl-tRNA synthetase
MIDEKVAGLVKELKQAGIKVKYDDSENARPGWKFAEYELKGVPVRIGIGARDIENNVVEVARGILRRRKAFLWKGLLKVL